LERNVRAVWAAIERAVREQDFRPNPSRLCSWCDFKPLCPAFGGTPPPMPVDVEIGTPETP
ncbi:MAG TPA: PD-(D/E)XK nuclease family protein, partial [Candidatus Janibacter merdipullorum]|nr:PD-(D/E)XK nuclease family protein [Candidatus Janibacter merdipullorum]